MNTSSQTVPYIFNYARPESRWLRWYRRTMGRLWTLIPWRQRTEQQ